MGDGLLGWAANVICILWTCFVCIIFALPTYLPVTGETMNYAAVRPAPPVLLALCRCSRSRRRTRTADHGRRHPAFSVSARRVRSEGESRLIARARVRSVWYFAGGRRHYKGPQSNRADAHGDTEVGALPSAEKAGAAGVV